MPWIAPAIAGAASLAGGMIASSGQQQTNAQMTANMLQNEQWQTQMSDTAVQRRMADIQAAGLNPQLAIGGGGAPAATVGSVSQPSLGNPGAPLGQGVAAAGSAASQVVGNELTLAQADKARADAAMTRATTPDQGQTQTKLAVDTGAAGASATEMAAQADNLKKSIDNIGAQLEQIKSQTKGQDISNVTQQKLQPIVIQMQAAQAKAAELGIPKAQAESDAAGLFQQGINAIKGGTQTAGEGIANAMGNLNDWYSALYNRISNHLSPFGVKPSQTGWDQ